MDYNKLLYEKLQQEYNNFIAGLKELPSEQVITYAYEKVMKEDLLSCFALGERSQKEAEALYLLPHPLNELYQEWLGNDYNYMDLLSETIDDRIKSAVKEMKEKAKESR